MLDVTLKYDVVILFTLKISLKFIVSDQIYKKI